MKRKAGPMLLVALLFLPASTSAAMLYDWVNDPAGTLQTIVDPVDVAEDSRDILGLWVASDAANYYFRIDTRGTPSQTGGQFSPEVGVQIDLNGPGIGGSSANTSYIAENLVGIDTILLSHFTVAGGWVMSHRHNYIGGAPPAVDTAMLGAIGGADDQSENAGMTVQWAIPKAQLGVTPFTVWGATLDINNPQTFDLTSSLQVVPEPATAALLTFGLLAWARRRRA